MKCFIYFFICKIRDILYYNVSGKIDACPDKIDSYKDRENTVNLFMMYATTNWI